MPRVLVFWSHPHHLTSEQAQRWTQAELDRLLKADGIERARLTRLEPASPGQARPCDWMLELELRPEIDVAACVGSVAWREWLGDLRLLGMCPSVLVAEGRP